MHKIHRLNLMRCVHFQINFTKTHKKLVICPKNETMTLVHGKITRDNFKTLTFASLATHRFSIENFQMIKYMTESLKFLVMKLKA